jgi:hypothetical protein
VVQNDGLAMGATSSDLIAEIFLHHIEHSQLTRLTQKHKITNYCRYVDVILLIIDSNHSNIQNILDDFNSLHPKLQFTAETEKDHTLNFLDVSTQNPDNLRTAIFRKPMVTDTSIPLPSTISHTTSTQQSNSYTTDLKLTTCNKRNTYRS